MTRIYADNAATTKISQTAMAAMISAMENTYGNPSSLHRIGMEANGALQSAREQISRCIGCMPREIYFTSGGTESNNLALIGGALANKRSGNHIITTAVEHAAVSQPVAFLQEQGFEVTILPVDAHGVVKLDALEKALRPDTILVSTMMVNNETGAVMPVEKIGAMIQEKCPKALYHVDAIQAFGKYRIYPKKWNIHLLSVSSHKIHGPKGVGFLYINSKAKVQPLILGGGQQNGMRSGTDNVPGIAGLGVAAKMMYQNFDEKVEHLYQLKERMAEGLSKIDDVVINGMPVREGAPHILSVSFLGIRSEVLLHTLEDRNIYVSAGSACSSHKRKPSATLSAMGMSNAQIENTVRISFSEENTFEEADYCLEVLNEVLPMLKRYARR